MVLLAAAIFRAKTTPTKGQQIFVFLLASALVVALAFSGHAGAGEGGRVAAQVIVIALHLFAVAIWLGALPPLAVFLVRLGTVQSSWPPGTLKQAIRRFSLLGLFCVGILLLSGIFNAWTFVGSIPAPLGTD